jgi:hypothetical protein
MKIEFISNDSEFLEIECMIGLVSSLDDTIGVLESQIELSKSFPDTHKSLTAKYKLYRAKYLKELISRAWTETMRPVYKERYSDGTELEFPSTNLEDYRN